VVAADVSFGNSVTVRGLNSFGSSSAGPILASTVAAGIVSEAKGIASICSAFSIFSVSSTTVVFSKGRGFGLRVRTFALFGLGAMEEDEAATFLFNPYFRAGKQ
jgi:hypothetical protein